MIRPFVHETLRYGAPSKLEESVYNRPFQWGSKRTGPDLARVGGKYPDMWHFNHMLDPRSTSPSSIMPNYSWLEDTKLRYDTLGRKIRVMKTLGVPYPDGYDKVAVQAAKEQAKEVAEGLMRDGGLTKDYTDYEIVALISYLQRLGQVTTDNPYLTGDKK